jgi:hypothetical protein
LALGIVTVTCALWIVPTRVACTGPNIGESTGWCMLAWAFLFGPLLIAFAGLVAGLLAPGRAGFAMWLVGVTAGVGSVFLLQSGAEVRLTSDVGTLLPPALIPALVGFPLGSWLGSELRRSWTRTEGGRVIPQDPRPGTTAGDETAHRSWPTPSPPSSGSRSEADEG